MATTGEINSHDRLIERLGNQFARGVSPLLTQLYDNLAVTENPDRLAVQNLFLPIRRYAQAQITQIDAVIEDNRAMNSEVFEGVVIDTSRLRAEATASLNAAIDTEANNINNILVTSAIVGGITAATIMAIRKTRAASIARLRIAYTANTRRVDNAYTLLATRASGVEARFRYVGGIIAESRPFCRQHDGRTMTEAEIRRIWSTQNWQGKSPGDPFVVRGGYNCRHMFVPVRDEQ